MMAHLATRKNKPRSERLAEDLRYFLPRLITRIGLEEGVISAQRHHASMTTPVLKFHGHQASAAVKTNQAGGEQRRSYTQDEMQSLVITRLSRLLKHCNFEFGEVAVDVKDGVVQRYRMTIKVLPEEMDMLMRFFEEC